MWHVHVHVHVYNASAPAMLAFLRARRRRRARRAMAPAVERAHLLRSRDSSPLRPEESSLIWKTYAS
eukprot:scaffold104360_cov45-Phaeocystis_antarctica.AAC.1